MRRIVMGVLLAAVATPAMAANWVLMFQDKVGSYYYDSADVGKTPSGYRSVWEKVVFADKTKDTEGTVLIYVNCEDSSASIKTMYTEHADGTTNQESMALKFQPIVPETLYDDFRNKVCP